MKDLVERAALVLVTLAAIGAFTVIVLAVYVFSVVTNGQP